MPANFPGSPSVNQTYTYAGITWTWTGSRWQVGPGGNTSLISTNIVPTANVTYDLGSASNRWRDLYLSGTTIDLGGTAIKSTANGVSFTNAANANVAVPLTVSSIQLGIGANAVTLVGNAGGLAVTTSDGNVSPVSGGGATVTVSNTTPTTTQLGSLWLDNDTGELRIFYGNAWAGIIGAGISSGGALNLDGGQPNSIYGGISAFDAGGVV